MVPRPSGVDCVAEKQVTQKCSSEGQGQGVMHLR